MSKKRSTHGINKSACKTGESTSVPQQESEPKTVVQAKLDIGHPDDRHEQQADAIADNILSEPGPNFFQQKSIQSSITPIIQAKGEGLPVSNRVSNKINSSKGNGSAMDNATQSFMQSRFGTDFSSVKIHTGSEAIQMNRELNAKAFTVGKDIYFNSDQYQPNTDKGKQILAHELTHVVQQSGMSAQHLQRQDDENPTKNSIIGEGTTDEVKAEIQRLETWLEENPDNGWKWSVLTKLKSLRTYLAERGDSTLADCDAELIFDCDELYFTGSKSDSFPAVSGPKLIDADNGDEYFDYSAGKQQVPGGPIPEGVYWINPEEIRGVSKIPVIKAQDPAWGNYRVVIHPFNSTRTYGRGGFFIHGGSQWGSVGCIDLVHHMDSFVKAMAPFHNCGFWPHSWTDPFSCNPCKVKLTVKYATPIAVIRY
jgi:hypothetical protein